MKMERLESDCPVFFSRFWVSLLDFDLCPFGVVSGSSQASYLDWLFWQFCKLTSPELYIHQTAAFSAEKYRMFQGVFRHPLPDSGESGKSQEPGLAMVGLQKYLATHRSHRLNKSNTGVFKMPPSFHWSVELAKRSCSARIAQGSGCIIEFPLTAVSKVCLGCLGCLGLNLQEIVQMVQQMQCTCKVQVGLLAFLRILQIPLFFAHFRPRYRIVKNDDRWFSAGSLTGPTPMPPLPLSNADTRHVSKAGCGGSLCMSFHSYAATR